MTFDQYKKSMDGLKPANMLPQLLQALWWDAKGQWDQSHKITQEIHSNEAAAVHAYLHRKEGDIGNAGYWYRSAGRPVFKGTLEEEWESLVRELLNSD